MTLVFYHKNYVLSHKGISKELVLMQGKLYYQYISFIRTYPYTVNLRYKQCPYSAY
jgi:hypothetical protein